MAKNGAANCALEICCLRGTPEHRAALVTVIAEGTGLSDEYAEKCADFLDANFDLMPYGTTKKLKDAIVAVWEDRIPGHGHE
jgi:hypothetical protein